MEKHISKNPEDETLAVKDQTRHSLLFHLHPTKINSGALKFSRTFGLGGMAVILICLQFITGILLRFHYEPFPGVAYESIVNINNYVLFGAFIRNIHHWSAVFLVIVSGLHLLRVFFQGAFYQDRKLNWLIGIGLLILVVLSNFTGYLLPWDQLSYWAITVSTGIIKYIPLVGNSLYELIIMGSEVNGETLLFFYNLHTSMIPILLIFFMLFHFWRVRKAGGILVPEEVKGTPVATVPELVYRELIAALAVIALICLFAALFNAPLLDMANPDVSPNPVKAPWYFAGLQELLLHFHPLFAGFMIPLILCLALFLLPYFKLDHLPDGKWFISEKGKTTSLFAFAVSAILTIVLVIIDEYTNDLSALSTAIPAVIANGLIPFILLILAVWGFSFILRTKFTTAKAETIQAVYIFIFSPIIILTFIGIFFRGINMELFLPLLN